MSDDLKRWALANLRRGVPPDSLRKTMQTDGVPEATARAVMGEAYDGRRPAEAADHAALAKVAITRRAEESDQVRRIPTPKAQIYVWDGFLTEPACRAIVAAIDSALRDSATVDPLVDAGVRTSRSSDIGGLGLNEVLHVENRICAGLGISWPYGEITQGQRYDVGQEYKAHHDYFNPGSADHRVHCQFLGQRTWTFMVYLNDVPDGGATRFRKLEKTFRPKTGRAVIWNNLNPDGTVNPFTLHHGMRVREGSKYVITKWFRERGWGPMFTPYTPL